MQRPANWLRLSTPRDRELAGITWVADTSNNYDQRFYWGVDNPKQLDDVTDDDGNTTTGLKTLWKAKQNEIAASRFAPSDWRVVKGAGGQHQLQCCKPTAYPSAWMTYRAAVRTACNTRQTEIDNCSDVAALKELLTGAAQIEQGNGVVDVRWLPTQTWRLPGLILSNDVSGWFAYRRPAGAWLGAAFYCC